MSRGVDLAAGIARWWVGAYTRTAPEPDAGDRRAEVESDLFEQDAAAAGRPGVGRAVTGRTVRGMPHDVAWRLTVEHAPGRLHWHLAHPTTVLGAALLASFIVSQVADVGRTRLPVLGALDAVLHPLLWLIWAGMLGFSVVAVAYVRRAPRLQTFADLDAWRCAAICVMAVAESVAGLWRWAPGSLGTFVSVAWGTFGIALLVWLATCLIRGVTAVARGLDLRKVPS